MIRIVLGSVAGAIAMFVAGFVLFATPLASIGYSHAPEQQSAAVQTALAQNLPSTGRYIVPDPGTASGTILFGRGPVATVDYNVHGFSASGGAPLVGGLILDFVVVLMFGLALRPALSRVADFATRARIVVGVSAAAAVMIELSNPVLNHTGWRFAVYATFADIVMLIAGGLVLARWFLPGAAGRDDVARATTGTAPPR